MLAAFALAAGFPAAPAALGAAAASAVAAAAAAAAVDPLVVQYASLLW